MLAGQGNISASLNDPLTLARTLTDNLNGPQDAAKIRSIHSYLARAQDARAKEVNDIQGLLKALSRQLEIAKESADRPARELSATQYVQRMANLDNERASVAKDLAEGEASMGALEDELRRLEEEREAWMREMEKDANLPPDEQILKLQIYRSLGIEFEKNESGAFCKGIVRSTKSKDIHTYDLDPKYSNFFYANVLWDLCQ
ncbi:kinetochore-associated Ndc80 complex subunit spc24 [Rhizophlyctis rosea]|nr:kinetochore-associated Ndc80 complex subunit spc24 [Rhizophlyctis rosea]